MTFFINQLKKLKIQNPLDNYMILDYLELKEKVRSAPQPTISDHISSSHAIKEGDM